MQTGVWVDSSKVESVADEKEKIMLCSYKIVSKVVSLLTPEECWKALKIIVDPLHSQLSDVVGCFLLYSLVFGVVGCFLLHSLISDIVGFFGHLSHSGDQLPLVFVSIRASSINNFTFLTS